MPDAPHRDPPGGLSSHLSEPVQPGGHQFQFLSTVFDLIDEKEYSFSFVWAGDETFTYTLDEMWFESAFEGWCHWEGTNLLVAYHQNGHTSIGCAMVTGVPDETEMHPERASWWRLMADLIIRAIWFGSDTDMRD